MKPDSTLHNPAPEYIRGLIERSGLTQVQAAIRIGIAPRTMRRYLAGELVTPYLVQFALEVLAQREFPPPKY